MTPRTAHHCPHCCAVIDPSATFCNHCGHTLPAIGATKPLPPTRPSMQRGSPILWGITIAVLGVVLGLVGVLWSRVAPPAPVGMLATSSVPATIDLAIQQTQVALQQTLIAIQQTQAALLTTATSFSKSPIPVSPTFTPVVLLSAPAPSNVTALPSIFTPDKSSIPVFADYDGDGKIDNAFWQPADGHWYIPMNGVQSSTEYLIVSWGGAGDMPVPGDYDGDGKAEIAIWRPSDGNWYISRENRSWSQKGDDYWIIQWGTKGDAPLPADYDGDGKVEIAIWRPSDGNWYISRENRSWTERGDDYWIIQWGTKGDAPLPADYDGDGKAEIAVGRYSEGKLYISTDNLSWEHKGDKFFIVDWNR